MALDSEQGLPAERAEHSRKIDDEVEFIAADGDPADDRLAGDLEAKVKPGLAVGAEVPFRPEVMARAELRVLGLSRAEQIGSHRRREVMGDALMQSKLSHASAPVGHE